MRRKPTLIGAVQRADGTSLLVERIDHVDARIAFATKAGRRPAYVVVHGHEIERLAELLGMVANDAARRRFT